MKNIAKEIFLEALDHMDPAHVLRELVHPDRLEMDEQIFEFKNYPSIYLFSVGKAAVPMARAVDTYANGAVKKAMVYTTDQSMESDEDSFEVLSGSHPLPDTGNVGATKKILAFLQAIPEGALLIHCLSGGTSSLLCLPADGISIEEATQLNQLLIESGAEIHEINTVRKHCSKVKGGQLLGYLNPEVCLIDLIFSDVPDDDLQIIGSGPTIPDQSTFQDARHVLVTYELWDQIPETIRMHIEKGLQGEVPETPEPRRDPLSGHHSFVIGSAKKLAETVAKIAGQKGFAATVADRPYTQNVEDVSEMIAGEAIQAAKDKAQKDKPKALIYYGESTVKVTGEGVGGRNQELALRGAMKIDGYEQITWLSAGTDGIDGPTDAAGAIVDGSTIADAGEHGIKPENYLAENDSYHFHQKMGTLLVTGPTGNNLMDIQLVLTG